MSPDAELKKWTHQLLPEPSTTTVKCRDLQHQHFPMAQNLVCRMPRPPGAILTALEIPKSPGKEEEGIAGSTRLFQITQAPPRSHF